MAERLIEKTALALTPGLSGYSVKEMLERGMDPLDFHALPAAEKRRLTGAQTDHAALMQRAREEADFMERHKIRLLFISDEDYPRRLRACADPPIALFVLGNAALLDSERIVSVVGTRKCTATGSSFCRKFAEDLGECLPDTLIVSGLAYGIDAAAHSGALAAGLPTVGVVAHGLDTIYPAQHRDLARRIVQAGGAIVSEYPTRSKPYRGNFLARNRIVAGLADAVVVVESDLRGGALSTANYAFGYNRDVFAVPGRPADQFSQGCNRLIYKEKAKLLTGCPDLLDSMGWTPAANSPQPKQAALFRELEPDAKALCELLQRSGREMAVDEIFATMRMPYPTLSALLVELEADGVVTKFPGNRYGLG